MTNNRQSSDIAVDQRVTQIMDMMAAGISRAAIIAWAQSPACPWRKPGEEPVSVSTIDRCIRKARAEFVKLAAPQKEFLLGRNIHRLEGMIQRNMAKGDDRIALDALKEENKLADLYQPTKIEASGKDGAPAIVIYLPDNGRDTQ